MIQNQLSKLLMLLIFSLQSSAYAQTDTPQVRQKATVSQQISITENHITYSESSFNCENIWDKQGLNVLVPKQENNIEIYIAKLEKERNIN